MSIILKTSPVNTNIPFIKRRARQKSIKDRKGVISNINNRNANAAKRSIAPRTFNIALIEKIENED